MVRVMSDNVTAETVAKKLNDFADRLEHVVQSGNHNTLSTVFNLGGVGLVVGALLGVLGAAIGYGIHVRAEARELVMAAERRADMAQLSTLMSRVEGVESQVRADRILITKAEQRITQLEPRP